MKSIKARATRSLPVGAELTVCDNSGAKIIKLISVKGYKTTVRRLAIAGVGDLISARVVKGSKELRKKVVQAIIVRQKKEYIRLDGTRIKFYDNAAVLIKDEKGNPSGTIFKGPIAKEATERWPGIAKIAGEVI